LRGCCSAKHRAGLPIALLVEELSETADLLFHMAYFFLKIRAHFSAVPH
jgi:hypothetical protein